VAAFAKAAHGKGNNTDAAQFVPRVLAKRHEPDNAAADKSKTSNDSAPSDTSGNPTQSEGEKGHASDAPATVSQDVVTLPGRPQQQPSSRQAAAKRKRPGGPQLQRQENSLAYASSVSAAMARAAGSAQVC